MAAATTAAAATTVPVSSSTRRAVDRPADTFRFDLEELEPEDIVMDLVLKKLCTTSYDGGSWQPRRVVLTSRVLFCYKESSTTMADMVPLHEITAIQLGTYSNFRRARALFRATTFDCSRHGRSAGNVAAMLGHMQKEFAQEGPPDGRLAFWMRKKGAVNPAWKRRYFVLEPKDRLLRYYTSATVYAAGSKPKGFIDLAGCQVNIQGELGILLQPSEAALRRGVYNDVIYECECESRKELAQLLAAIERVNYESDRKPSLVAALGHASPQGGSDLNDEAEREPAGPEAVEEFFLETSVQGINDGKPFFFRAADLETATQFVNKCSELVKQQQQEHEKDESYIRIRSKLVAVHNSTAFQSLVGLLIMGNFIVAMVQLEMRDNADGRVFYAIEVMFSVLFALEVVFKMIVDWFWPYWSSWFNVFDLCIVLVTLVSLGPLDMSVIATLRLLRAFRIIRIFNRLESARKIVLALMKSFVPLCNVLVVVLGIMSTFAMFGATAFREAPVFWTFSTAMYTLFQVMCLDGWADIVDSVESAYEVLGTEPGFPVRVFFISYIIVLVFILMPVVVAAILDNYRLASLVQAQEAEERRIQEAVDSGKHDQLNGFDFNDSLAIDPILEVLMNCPSRPVLYERLSYLFDVMDGDGSGTVSYQEMKTGLKKWCAKSAKRGQKLMTLDQEEYEHITQGSRFSTDGEMTLEQFQHALELQIRLYVERKMSRQMAALAREDPCAHLMIFGLKCAVSDSHEMIGVHRWHMGGSAQPKQPASREYNQAASAPDGRIWSRNGQAFDDHLSSSLTYKNDEESGQQKSIDTGNSLPRTRAHHLKALSHLVDLDQHRKNHEFIEALPPNMPGRPLPLAADPQSVAPPFLDHVTSAPISLSSMRTVEESDRNSGISGRISDRLFSSQKHASYGQLPQVNGLGDSQYHDPGRNGHLSRVSRARRSQSAYELGAIKNLD